MFIKTEFRMFVGFVMDFLTIDCAKIFMPFHAQSNTTYTFIFNDEDFTTKMKVRF